MSSVIKYMSLLTTFSVFAALISIVWQAFLSLKHLNKVTTILTGLLAIESSFKKPTEAPRIAVGYGACSDLLLDATEFLNFTKDIMIGNELEFNLVQDRHDLLKTFAYYFQNGAAAERIMTNGSIFHELIQTAKSRHSNHIQWFLGGNAPLMSARFHLEGGDVLLGARMSRKLRRLLPSEIKIAGDEIPEDDIHLILEYKAGDTWGSLTAPRANRFILHNDEVNTHLYSIYDFDEALRNFRPRLLVISGLQMLDGYGYYTTEVKSILLKIKEQISSQPLTTLVHFEMASFVDLILIRTMSDYMFSYLNSIGMNEQELENLRQWVTRGQSAFATDSNPRVATTLDKMRTVFQYFIQQYHKNETNCPNIRLMSRIHVHTLAYQAIMTLHNSNWKHSQLAAAKASLTAHRHVCQTDLINPEAALLILDESFATSAESNANRIQLDPQQPVSCWNETIWVHTKLTLPIEVCVVPVLVCRVAKKTAGAGDNISAAALIQQL